MQMKRKLVTAKKYVQRSTSYAGILNSVLLGIIFLSDRGFEINMWRWGIPLIIITLLGMLVFGYVEDKVLGLYEEEINFGATRNPVLMEIREDVKDMKEKQRLSR